jgi:light-regulated signal transduction histidine kinase (bacteriophytochrome)
VRADLVETYLAGLEAYLRNRSEVALSGAYELGRRAIAEGLGVLDMAALQRAAVERAVLAAPTANRDQVATAAAEYFNELLAPFEMSYRGYRLANEELQRLNERLQQQKEAVENVNQELEQFSHSVSHDLRAPLARIDGFAELVIEREGAVLSEPGRRYLEFIRVSTAEALQLIKDLLNLARVTRTEMTREDVDLSSICARLLDTLKVLSPARAVELRIQPDVHARADGGLMGIALENLLKNAWKFTSKRERAVIEFGSERRADGMVYFVRDNGAGFDMTYVGKLFGTFSRLHSSNEFEGTGIGLATVQRIIRRHGGKVWAEGEVDRGATFCFTLPEP